MRNIEFNTPEETIQFQHIMDNIIPRLTATKNGPALILLLAQNDSAVTDFIADYCNNITSKFIKSTHANSATEYTDSIKALGIFAGKYEEVRKYLTEISNELSQAKAGAEVISENPGYFQNIIGTLDSKQNCIIS
jgi:ABC-type Fe3+-hydroxamate transport system substrate-binding protein